MAAWWSGSVAAFLAADPAAIEATLSHAASREFRTNEPAQRRAWAVGCAILADALRDWPAPYASLLCLEWAIPRLGGRADAVLVTTRAVFVVEFKIGADRFDPDGRRQVEGYALDLQDFHAGSRSAPIVPVLVATEAAVSPGGVLALLIGGVTSVQDATPGELGMRLRSIDGAVPSGARPIDVAGWERARYDPVPGIVDAACLLFARHDVADIAAARADTVNLTDTADAIDRHLRTAEREAGKIAVFITGIPGAGKTLCGLNAAFRRIEAGPGRAFLTGNPTLVHVLRAALVRDVVARGGSKEAAGRRAMAVIQQLTRFRDHGVASRETPPERVVVIDEAQRSWTAAHALAKTRDRPVRLDRSEPAHLLDIMSRHVGFAALVCLVGNGQEIHDGEGGLRAWGEALAERSDWRVAHAPDCLDATETRTRLPPLAGSRIDRLLHLAVPVRSIRHRATPSWVEAVLAGDATEAASIAASEGDLPFRLTRDLAALRAGLRAACRETHRAGLVASSNARRLRAEGLGAELPHMDAAAVAHWFLDRWIGGGRDVRASDALETVATEFSVQGLELDHVGLCWGGDLIRDEAVAWRARRFVGTRWQVSRDADKISWRLAAYRVLLTRARYGTIIWVPPGDADDPTRPPWVYDAVADFLAACGVRPLAIVGDEVGSPALSPSLFDIKELSPCVS